MGVRSGGEPATDQSFVQRLLHALDMTRTDLANEIAQGDKSMYRLVLDVLNEWQHASPSKLPDVDRDVVWFKILAYIDKQFAYTMAAKHEVNTLLLKQRQQRAAQSLRQQALADLSAPTSLPRRTR